VGNAGTYEAVDGDCASLAESVHISPVPRDGGPPVDASRNSSDAGACGGATCTTVCALEDGGASCLSQCEQEQAECSGAAKAFQGLLTCVCQHPTTTMGPVNDACLTEAEALVAGCPAIGPALGIDAGPTHP
jgi:hypothetical protein